MSEKEAIGKTAVIGFPDGMIITGAFVREDVDIRKDEVVLSKAKIESPTGKHIEYPKDVKVNLNTAAYYYLKGEE